MSIDEIHDSNRQAQLLWEHYAGRHPRGEIVRYAGVTAVWCHTQWPLLNATVITSPVSDDLQLEHRIQTALEHGRQRDKLWLLVCCKAWLPGGGDARVQETFARHGLHEILTMTGMATEEVVPATRQAGGLELRPVADAETRNAVADINAVGYEVPIEWGREGFAEPAVWPGGVFGCVGYAEGKAVTTATTLILDGIRYVGLVATLPECRRRGYAEAVMRRSLEMAYAATGIQRTVLHATAMGRPTYEKMGYRAVAEFGFYMLPH
jgi:GNAT superfamily N-acetyltransferase